MRLLFLSWEYPPHLVGGLGRHVLGLARELAPLGLEIDLFTPRRAGGQPLESQGGLTVHRVEVPESWGRDIYGYARQVNQLLTRAAARHLERRPADLLHAHDWLVAFAAVELKERFKLPLVVTMHATERGRSAGKLNGDLSRAIDATEWRLGYEAWRVIAASRFMAGELHRFFLMPADKIDVVPNGVEPPGSVAPEVMASLRRRLAANGQPLVVGVGRLVWEKGFHRLLEAFPGVLALLPQARLVVAGEGPLEEQLRRQARALGDRATLLGHVSDEERNGLYELASCVVFPSLYEPFGIAALEAMARRRPVVVSEIGGLSELVQLGVSGVTVPPDDPTSLAWGMLQVLERPREAAGWARRAQKLVREHYSWPKVAQQTVPIYERVLRERATVEW